MQLEHNIIASETKEQNLSFNKCSDLHVLYPHCCKTIWPEMCQMLIRWCWVVAGSEDENNLHSRSNMVLKVHDGTDI